MEKQNITPQEKLIAERRLLKEQCNHQETKLNDDFKFIHRHAGTLLIDGLQMLFFPHKEDNEEPETENNSAERENKIDISHIKLGLSDYLDIAKNMIPAAWEILRPALISYGIQAFKGWLDHKLFHKGAKKHDN